MLLLTNIRLSQVWPDHSHGQATPDDICLTQGLPHDHSQALDKSWAEAQERD